ncbi:tetratricopeptide repeat protein [Stygiolobus azoricus]|uniref:Tetratricopeptide repeat protein n=1 Tax=Stygiolobus azoricus TaxID=41675 RepID=A0A650CPM4_9CREN|nr:tetratricopeptide repeat protein [Stygiolobus azoricus]QGR19791.1 tetratricopeptide repeat protein [Stygiolobus azoricus]
MVESPQGTKLKIEELRRLSQINPSDPWPHFLLGEIYSTLNPEEALKEYNEAIKLDPHVIDFHYKKALLLFNLGKIDEALECLEKASIIDYKNSSIYYFLKGNFLDELGKYDEAIKEYEKAIKKDPNNPWIIEAKILDMVELGLVNEALNEIDNILKTKNFKNLIMLREKIVKISQNELRSVKNT